MHRSGDSTTLRALEAGMAIPFLYYGVQALAVPFFPDFSLVGTTASELGSDRSTRPSVFNAGVIVQGVASLIAAAGFLRALARLGAHPVLSWSTSIAVAIAGLSSLWAGYHPLPDPSHGGHPAFLFALLLIPFLLTADLWRGGTRALRAYLVANLLLLLVMVPIMSGTTNLDTHAYRGIFQRVFAFTVFPPIGVAAGALAGRIRSRDPASEG